MNNLWTLAKIYMGYVTLKSFLKKNPEQTQEIVSTLKEYGVTVNPEEIRKFVSEPDKSRYENVPVVKDVSI